MEIAEVRRRGVGRNARGSSGKGPLTSADPMP